MSSIVDVKSPFHSMKGANAQGVGSIIAFREDRLMPQGRKRYEPVPTARHPVILA